MNFWSGCFDIKEFLHRRNQYLFEIKKRSVFYESKFGDENMPCHILKDQKKVSWSCQRTAQKKGLILFCDWNRKFSDKQWMFIVAIVSTKETDDIRKTANNSDLRESSSHSMWEINFQHLSFSENKNLKDIEMPKSWIELFCCR